MKKQSKNSFTHTEMFSFSEKCCLLLFSLKMIVMTVPRFSFLEKSHHAHTNSTSSTVPAYIVLELSQRGIKVFVTKVFVTQLEVAITSKTLLCLQYSLKRNALLQTRFDFV